MASAFPREDGDALFPPCKVVIAPFERLERHHRRPACSENVPPFIIRCCQKRDDRLSEVFRRRLAMEQNRDLVPEDRARITEIQDLLIERYVEQKEALIEGNRCRALELEFEIKELLHEKKKSSSGRLTDRPRRWNQTADVYSKDEHACEGSGGGAQTGRRCLR